MPRFIWLFLLALPALAAPPQTIDDLKALYPPLADDANGAPLFMKAADALVKPSVKATNMLPYVGNMKTNVPVQKINDERMALMAGWLAQNLPALELVRVAAAVGASQYPINFDNMAQARQLDFLGRLRSLTQLTSVKALFDALRGNDAAAVEAVTLGMAVANSLSEDPLMMSHGVRFALYNITVDAMEQVINRRALTEKQLAGLQQLMLKSVDVEGMARAIEVELCIGAAAKPADAADATKQEEWLAKMRPVPDAIRALSKPASTAAAPPLDSTAIPIVSGCKNGLAHLRLAIVLLGLELYRAAKGAYPNKLEELVPDYMPEVPIDPFDGQPLRYKAQDGGVFVWSVFQNGVDDGCNFHRFAKPLDLALVVFRD